MIYEAKIETKNKLLSLPESGMGYQTISGIKRRTYNSQNFVVLNASLIIEYSDENTFSSTVKQILNEGFENLLSKSPYIELNDIHLINYGQTLNVLKEEETQTKKGAKDNIVEDADGKEVFVRLSAYEDDNRVDQKGVDSCPALMPPRKKMLRIVRKIPIATPLNDMLCLMD